ncbi:MAG: hypothetical protein V2A73_13355, partial [Pseudomonadota bacterium]
CKGGTTTATIDSSDVDSAKTGDAKTGDAHWVDGRPIDAPVVDAKSLDAAPPDAPAIDADFCATGGGGVDAAPLQLPKSCWVDFINSHCSPSGRCQFENLTETEWVYDGARFCFCSGHKVSWMVEIPSIDDPTEPYWLGEYAFYDNEEFCLWAVWDYSDDESGVIDILYCPPEAAASGNCVREIPHIEVDVAASHELLVTCPDNPDGSPGPQETWSGEEAEKLLEYSQPWRRCIEGLCPR